MFLVYGGHPHWLKGTGVKELVVLFMLSVGKPETEKLRNRSLIRQLR